VSEDGLALADLQEGQVDLKDFVSERRLVGGDDLVSALGAVQTYAVKHDQTHFSRHVGVKQYLLRRRPTQLPTCEIKLL